MKNIIKFVNFPSVQDLWSCSLLKKTVGSFYVFFTLFPTKTGLKGFKVKCVVGAEEPSLWLFMFIHLFFEIWLLL